MQNGRDFQEDVEGRPSRYKTQSAGTHRAVCSIMAIHSTACAGKAGLLAAKFQVSSFRAPHPYFVIEGVFLNACKGVGLVVHRWKTKYMETGRYRGR